MIEKKSLFVFLIFLCGTISTSSPMQQEQNDQEDWTIITEAAYFIIHTNSDCICGSRKLLITEENDNPKYRTFPKHDCSESSLTPHYGLLLLYYDQDGDILFSMNLAPLPQWNTELLIKAAKRLDPNVNPSAISWSRLTHPVRQSPKIYYVNNSHKQDVTGDGQCECIIS